MIDSLGNDRLSDSLKSMLNTAIQQRTSVGITGLIIALFTGLVRNAIKVGLFTNYKY